MGEANRLDPLLIVLSRLLGDSGVPISKRPSILLGLSGFGLTAFGDSAGDDNGEDAMTIEVDSAIAGGIVVLKLLFDLDPARSL